MIGRLDPQHCQYLMKTEFKHKQGCSYQRLVFWASPVMTSHSRQFTRHASNPTLGHESIAAFGQGTAAGRILLAVKSAFPPFQTVRRCQKLKSPT